MNSDLPPDNKDKRPRVTLELTAKEVETGGGEREQRALPPSSAAPEPEEKPAADEPRAGPETVAPPPPRRGGVSFALIFTHFMAALTGGLLALAVGFFTVAEFSKLFVRTDTRAVEAVKTGLADLQQRIAAMQKAAPSADPAQAAEVKRLNERVAALSTRLNGAEQRIASLAAATPGAPAAAVAPLPPQELDLKPVLEPLETRVTALETKVAQVSKLQSSDRQTAAATALAVGVNNLRRAVASGKPYAAELDVVQRLGASSSEVAALTPAKAEGIATPEALAQTITPLVREASRAASRGAAGEGVVSKLWSEARSVVHIRRTGMAEGDTPEAILARVEARAKAGDIAAAVKEAKALQGEPAVILRPWLAKAEARADADAALDRIEAKMLVALKSEGTAQ